MNKFFAVLQRIELAITMSFAVGFTSVLMLGAVLRNVGHPLNWCNDLALLMLAWTTFLGGDIAFRNGRLVNVNLLAARAPINFQKGIAVLVYLILLTMMGTMVWQGFRLCANVGTRTLEGLSMLSYAWVAAAMPVSFSCMILTAIDRLIHLLKSNDRAEISNM